ncbi:hypothetical protein K443DRAFT_679680 [Laccaria amethystina LaAM-08-1]|uniref:Uncharacterized protein n=1 Tax=Laccaria amethystina LaAM-08-1 TaxID=1095629 RepID=A0A0C9XV50_9AGAR|nr:hypothetical protein K443DRAFT_679680 [Laccaria amethystina LaAM-08-1]
MPESNPHVSCRASIQKTDQMMSPWSPHIPQNTPPASSNTPPRAHRLKHAAHRCLFALRLPKRQTGA